MAAGCPPSKTTVATRASLLLLKATENAYVRERMVLGHVMLYMTLHEVEITQPLEFA